VKKTFNIAIKGIETGALPNIILLIGTSISIIWAAYFALVTISIPYQIEFREGTALVLTRLMLSGQNPFILENQPLAMNNYGIGYNLAVLPFASLFGNTLWIHRSITLVFILLSAITCAWIVYQTKQELSNAIVCGTFVMIGLIARGGVGAFPSAMGTFFFLTAIFLPFGKSFNTASLIFSVLFSLVAFYTKAYFVLGFGIVASYLILFVSKKKGIFFSLLFFTSFTLSFFLIRFLFPLYFINTIEGNIANTTRSFEHLLNQLKDLGIYFFPVLILVLYFVGKKHREGREKKSSISESRSLINLFSLEHPLLLVAHDYLFYLFIGSLLAFLFILGPHIGSYLSYAYQILVPTFFCWFFQWFEFKKKRGILYALLVIFNLYFWEGTVIPPRMLEQKNSESWAEIYSYIQPSLSILNSPVVTSRIVDVQSNPMDSGQTAYFYAIKPYTDNKLFGPPYDTIYADGYKYIKSIDNSIERKKFDLIITTTEKTPFYHSKLIGGNYSLLQELVIDMPQTDQQWTVQIWKPLEKK